MPFRGTGGRAVFLTHPALNEKVQSFFFVIAVNIPPKNKAAIAIAPKPKVFAF
jgi:hypothetical protein